RTRSDGSLASRSRADPDRRRCGESALRGCIRAVRVRLPDAQPVHGYRGRLPRSASRASAWRRIPVRGRTLRRKLSLRLYRCPYYNNMKPWERRLHDWGLLGYLVQDVIGAYQEDSFGIRQNHTMTLVHWNALIEKYFVQHEYEVFAPERGWGERIVKQAALSELRAARWLGGTLAAVCKKSGGPGPQPVHLDRFESLLRCPDCRSPLTRDSQDALHCAACPYSAANEGDVYNLLPSAERRELYPGEREDI